MKNLLKKFRENKKGFTLAELLVVVAIVGILVAISIPVFTAQLGKARVATNQANLRAAKAAAVSEYLTTEGEKTDDTKIYTYTVSTGTLETGDKTKSADAVTMDSVSKSATYTHIAVSIDKDNNVTFKADTAE